MLNFAEPRYLYALLLIPVWFLFWFWSTRRRQKDLDGLGSPALMSVLTSSVNRRGRFWKILVWFAVYILLIVSLARPRWGSQVQKIESQGIQVILALDVSPSMLAEDVKPSRLERAKMEAIDLLSRLGGDEVGLVLFSGSAYLQFPLTNDYGTARSFIEAAAPQLISRPGTGIGEAVRIAARSFDSKRTSQKVVLILSDGEDHAADTLESVRQAAEGGVRVDAIGFGTPQGAPIPQYNENGEVSGFLKNNQGAVVITKMDENALQSLSAVGKGSYRRAGASGSELGLLLADWGRLQKDRGETQFEHLPIERFQIFLLPALILLVIMELIPDRKSPSKIRPSAGKAAGMTGMILVLAILICGCSASPQRLNNLGNDYYQKGDYVKAADNYRQSQAKLPDAPEPVYNEANSAYRRGAYDQAAQTLQKALEKARGELAEKVFYNLGNAFYQASLWDKAADAYRNALRILPSDQDAKANLELALKKQEEQKQQHEQQKQQQQDKQGQNQANKNTQPPPGGATPSPQAPSQAGGTPPAQSTPQPATAGGMSPEQARQLLDAAAQDTQSLQQYLQKLQPTKENPLDEAW